MEKENKLQDIESLKSKDMKDLTWQEMNILREEAPDFITDERAMEYLTSRKELQVLQKATELDDDYDEIEELKNDLAKIPTDTPPVKLMEELSSLFYDLIYIDRITAENFILYNIKEHFKITKEDAKKYITHLNALRKRLIGKKKDEKTDNNLPLILDRDINSQEVFDAISDIGIVNEETFKIVTAVIISAQLRLNPPLWLFLIGVPSSFKTELVGLSDSTKEVFSLDTLTENAFASGFMPPDGSDPQDLLPLLDNKCFIIKDLNTLFSMNEESVKKILGDLTSIFDGKFQKFTATRGMIQYNSLFSMIGCITPSILIKHYNYATQLGPRFLFLHLPELTDEEMQKSFDKSWSETDRKQKIINTRQIYSSYCTQLINKIKQYKNDPESKEIQKKINNIARFISKARGIAVTRNSSFEKDGKKIDYYEITDWQVEHPWRILNQLKSLLRILSFINGKTIVQEEELNIIKPIILSTMPVDRADILHILIKDYGLSASKISKKLEKSSKTIRRTLKELEALKIVDSYLDQDPNKSGQAPSLYFIVPEFASIVGAPVPPPEFLSQSKSILDKAKLENEDNFDEFINDLNENKVENKNPTNDELPF